MVLNIKNHLNFFKKNIFILKKILRVTLFDDEEDDIFDGTLGEDDEDVPRAYMSFKLSTVFC